MTRLGAKLEEYIPLSHIDAISIHVLTVLDTTKKYTRHACSSLLVLELLPACGLVTARYCDQSR